MNEDKKNSIAKFYAGQSCYNPLAIFKQSLIGGFIFSGTAEFYIALLQQAKLRYNNKPYKQFWKLANFKRFSMFWASSTLLLGGFMIIRASRERDKWDYYNKHIPKFHHKKEDELFSASKMEIEDKDEIEEINENLIKQIWKLDNPKIKKSK